MARQISLRVFYSTVISFKFIVVRELRLELTFVGAVPNKSLRGHPRRKYFVKYVCLTESIVLVTDLARFRNKAFCCGSKISVVFLKGGNLRGSKRIFLARL